jgi:hypothetical protein
MSGALIVTALLDAASQARFDDKRRRYFPAARNFLSAHVTLFHALPGAEVESVARTLEEVCRGCAMAPFETRGLLFLGRGVAYALHMPEVAAVRARLAGVWADWLTPQDRQGFRPHLTVQNKVTPDVARALLGELEAGFSPWRGEVVGLGLWRYEGGPWAHVRKMRFGTGDEPT